MNKIELTQGKFAIVDADDFDRVSQFKWCYNKNGKYPGYAERKQHIGMKDGKQIQKRISMHRFIMGVEDSKVHVDHMNHDTLDNRKSNLRLCTNAENGRNRKIQKGGSSKYKGVCKRRNNRVKAFEASIKFNKKTINLGMFATELEAAIAYNKAALHYFGEFALLNDVSENSLK
jgi:hypothetical protein